MNQATLALISNVLRTGSVTPQELSRLHPNDREYVVVALLCDPDRGIVDENGQATRGWARHIYDMVGDQELVIAIVEHMHKLRLCKTADGITTFDLPHSVDKMIKKFVLYRTCMWVLAKIAEGDDAALGLDGVVPSTRPPVMFTALDKLSAMRRVAAASAPAAATKI